MANPSYHTYVLTIDCPDRRGIVHAVTGFLVRNLGNIVESQQFDDPVGNRFFMRIHFEAPPGSPQIEALKADFAEIAYEYEMEWQLWDASIPYRTLIMVGKEGHCLHDLLYRLQAKSLNIVVPAVVSNHRNLEPLVRSYGIDFHHVPVKPDTKQAAEERMLDLVDEHRIHLVVLARYMQVLSDDACKRLEGMAINIHHSFLPGFKGARPYHQAHERGVKLIGATAHYVTSDLDEGPIIEQDIVRVDHRLTAEQLVEAGRDVECQVLSRAVRWHADTRVLTDGHRTVVFR